MPEWMRATLFIVSTPIGNLEDITLRALRVLREVDVILAEDTRRTRILCTHHGVRTRLRALHAHSSAAKVARITAELAEGASFALVTDAGTPVISDPGSALVRAAQEDSRISVEVVPGPSAVTAALACSGLRCDTFRFVGFVPRASKKRREALRAVARDESATVLFESPLRLPRTLADLQEVAGPERRAAICRELTKKHEDVRRGTLAELAALYCDPPRGEITMVVEGRVNAKKAGASATAVDALVESHPGSVRDAAKDLAEQLGISKREAYARALSVRGKKSS